MTWARACTTDTIARNLHLSINALNVTFPDGLRMFAAY